MDNEGDDSGGGESLEENELSVQDFDFDQQNSDTTWLLTAPTNNLGTGMGKTPLTCQRKGFMTYVIFPACESVCIINCFQALLLRRSQQNKRQVQVSGVA